MDSQTKKVQTRKTFEAFQEKPKTMKQVSVETGIMRPNICRYVAALRKSKKIALVKTGKCPVTNHKAQFFTTDADRVKEIHRQREMELEVSV